MGALLHPRTGGIRNGTKTEHMVGARRRSFQAKGRGLPDGLHWNAASLATQTHLRKWVWLARLECCMATSIAAVAVRQLAKFPYEAGLALQLSLARKYKEEQLDEVRANLK